MSLARDGRDGSAGTGTDTELETRSEFEVGVESEEGAATVDASPSSICALVAAPECRAKARMGNAVELQRQAARINIFAMSEK